MSKWKVGIIGAGGIAKAQHLPAWKSLKNVEVLAISDVRKEAAENLAKQFEIPHIFDNYKKMLEMDELNIIDICAPNAVHHPASIAAFKANKHVISEKPLAITPLQIEEMISASKKAKKKLMSIQNYRFRSECQFVKKLIQDNELGEIYYARAHALRRRLLPTAQGFIKKELSGGGPCLDIGVHILDLTLWLMGFPKLKSVSGIALAKLAKKEDIHGDWGEWDRKAYNVEDFATGFVKFENGASLNLECSFLLNMKESEIFATNIFGTEGGLYLPYNCPPEIYKEKKRNFAIEQLLVKPDITPLHTLQIQAFVEALEKNKEVPVLPEESLEVIKIIDGIYRSTNTGKEIKFN